MSDNTNLTTTEEQTEDLAETPIIQSTGNVEVRDFDAVDDDHPLVQYAGKSAMQTDANGGGQFISEAIYENDKAWVREWLQNEEAACVRAAKLFVKMSDEYPDGWLDMSMWINVENGETVIDYDEPQSLLAEYDDGDAADLREITVPRPIDDVLKAARSLGYDPTIEWEVNLDERQITTTDNGDGMTARVFWEAFESPFSSGSGVDGETGGKFGVGSESVRIVYGEEGGAEVECRSRRPGDHEAFRAYTYSGGATAIPGEVDDDFYGTKFIIPVQESFNLSKLQGWVEEYTDKLRVPVKYDEYDAGSNPVDEEYEATDFVDDYDDPPIVVERPGEFSLVAGPDVIETGYNADDNDTFLISMPINRNTGVSINTFWNVVLQIHDEQGRIVAGPHRGFYSDGVKVYKTIEKEVEIDDLDEDDVINPEPTGDRDRFQQDSASKNFFRYIQEFVKEKELKEVSKVVEEMESADHPADAIQGNRSNWQLFTKMVNYHGSYRVTDSRSKFKHFLDDADSFPDFDDTKVRQIYSLFQDVEHCHNGPGRSSRKSRRRERPLGDILAANDPDTVFMAASTGGNFTQRYKVIGNTFDSPEVIVINGASKYDKWSKLFGFNILKEVPLTDTDEDDHDFDVPDHIHENNINKGSNRGKADKVADRALKIRTDDDNSSIDFRLSIKDAKDRLESDMKFGGHSKLVLFPQTHDANISDHYDFSKYAAIASVSQKEYDELADYDSVLTYKEYTEWSQRGLIATEDGAMTPEELIEDDRMVVLAYREPHDKDVVKLLGDDFEQLREYYCNDVRDQHSWAQILDDYDGSYRSDDIGNVDDADKDDTLFAVAGAFVLGRTEWAFNSMDYTDRDLIGLKLTRNRYKRKVPCRWNNLNKSTKRYRLMADTPNWDDESDVYELFPRKRDSWKAQVLLGFHDRDIDPTEKDNQKLRELINGQHGQ
jgi:hypothetical protein